VEVKTLLFPVAVFISYCCKHIKIAKETKAEFKIQRFRLLYKVYTNRLEDIRTSSSRRRKNSASVFRSLAV